MSAHLGGREGQSHPSLSALPSRQVLSIQRPWAVRNSFSSHQGEQHPSIIFKPCHFPLCSAQESLESLWKQLHTGIILPLKMPCVLGTLDLQVWMVLGGNGPQQKAWTQHPASSGEQQLCPAELRAQGVPLEARWSLCSAGDGSFEHTGDCPD